MTRVVRIVGRRNHGKTEVTVDLVRELTGRGLRVATVKHSPHRHELDTPGKDSYRHRQAGASPACVATPDLAAAYIVTAGERDPEEALKPLLELCDLTLVEGGVDRPGHKVEVWRAEPEGEPMARSRRDIAAVITDDPVEVDVPVWPRSDVKALVDRLLELTGVTGASDKQDRLDG